MTARRTLPQRRHSETFELKHGKVSAPFVVTVGYYADGVTPGEVFVAGSKSGSDFEAVARDGAILLSLAIQHGVPLDTIKHAVTREGNGAPSTIIGAVVDRLSR